ncbi:topless-related protein 4-like [Bidens hawaiensis]|uniref:topless-related protein 4-like n=1 Tax=Bidens hawaiensis TaxID=980011 RepID=UPI00404AD87A
MSDVIDEPPLVPSGPKEITEPSQIRSLRLPDTLLPVEVLKIVHYGDGILALAYNAVHKLWKWPKNAQTQTANASVDVAPQLCQLRSGILMTNDIKDVNLEDRLASLAVSDNHCYAVSTSGGKISLFNLMTFKVNDHNNIHVSFFFFFFFNVYIDASKLSFLLQTMSSFLAPPPTVTSLILSPVDNNIVIAGMLDGSIIFYNAKNSKVPRLATKTK